VLSVTTTIQPSTAVADIQHYRELLATVRYISNADSTDLIFLLGELPTPNYNQPYSFALNTAIYQRWAEIDIDEALSYASDQFNNRNGRYNHDPQQAISILAALKPEYVQEWINNNASKNSSLLHAAYSGIASSDPESFLRNLLATSDLNNSLHNADHGELTGAIHTAIMKWADKDPQAAMAFLETEGEQLDSSGRLHLAEGMKQSLLYTWFDKDPDAAIVEIEALMNDPTASVESQMMFTDLYSRHLATDDPDTALQWALAQESPMLRDNALMNIIHSWDSYDSTGLVSFIDQLPGDQKNSILPMAGPQIAMNMARNDPASAIAWAEQLPAGSREQALSGAVHQWIESDPTSAMSWIQNLPDTPENQLLLMEAASSLVYRNPDLSTEVFSRLPETMQASLVNQMVYMQAERSPESAREWISQQNNPTVRELGFITLDSMDPNVDAVTLLDRVASLQTVDRENLLMNVISTRAGTDIEFIKQWVTTSPLLTESERTELTDVTKMFSSGYSGSGYSGGYYRRLDPETR